MAIQFLNTVQVDTDVLYVDTSSNRVGIGTTSPSANLHVYTSTNSSTIEVGRGAGRSSIKASADADGGYLALDSAANGLILNHYSSDNVWLVTGGGNVGIGTTSPADKLEVNGNLSIFGNKIYNGSASNSAGVSFPGSTTRIDGYNGITFHSSTTTVGSQSERMRITNAGNVGIGTTSPGAKLHIQSGNISTNEVNVIKLSNTVGVGGGPSIFFKTSGADADNRYGVKLGARRSDSDNGSSVFKIQQELDNGSGTLIGLQDVFTINQYGNVGIGTTSPQSKLQINDGSINVTKAMQSGGVDHDFLQLSYAGSWGNNIGGLASINFTDNLSSSNTVGRIGVTYTGSQGKFVVTDLYSGGYGGSGDVFTIQADGQTYIKGNVGIGTTSATGARLVVASGGTDPQILVKNTAGNDARILFEDNSGGTQNASIKFNQASQNTLTIETGYQSTNNTNRIYIAPAGNVALTAMGGSGGSAQSKVGIGTTTPSQKLEVNGAVLAGDYRGSAQIYLTSPDSWIFRSTGGSERMRVTSAGNVGIGTTSPLDLLALHNNATGAVDAQMNFTTAATGQTSADGFRIGWNGSVAQMYLFENADMRFATNNAERMRITSGGNVGIGVTSNTTHKLIVSGGSNIASFRSEGSGQNLKKLSISTGGDRAVLDASTTAGATTNFAFQTGGTERMRIKADGFIRLGSATASNAYTAAQGYVAGISSPTSNGQSYLSISLGGNSMGDTGIIFGLDSAGGSWYHRENKPLRLYTNNFERMRVTGGGNVGIGTTNPGKKLEVAGSYKLGTNAYIEYGGVYPYTITTANTAAIGNLVFSAGLGSAAYESRIDLQGTNAAGVAGITLSTAATARMVVTADGNVGIGTTSPSALGFLETSLNIAAGSSSSTTLQQAGLVVSGSSDANDSDDFGYLSFTNHQSTLSLDRVAEIRINKAGSNVNTGKFHFYTANGTALNESMVLGETGLLRLNQYGAGTLVTDASGNITVSSGGGAGGPYLPLSAGSGYPLTDTLYGTKATFGDTNIDVATVTIEGGMAGILDIWRNGTNASYQAIRFRDDTNANTEASIGWGSNQLRLNGTSTIVATTGGSERMRITSTGNVGIGTTNPGRQLELRGEGVVRLNGISGGDPGIDFQTSDVNDMQIRYRATTDVLAIYSYGTSSDVVNIKKSSGNVGIGVTPRTVGNYRVLDISGGTGAGGYIGLSSGSTQQGELYSHSGGVDLVTLGAKNTRFYNNGSERMRIDSSGNVGIGTTSPNYRLSVSGGIQAGGVVTYSKVASSLDTTGFAIAGLGTAFNGSSAGFTFTAYGGTGKYQKVVYSCYGSGTTWYVKKVIDEGTNTFDIAASASSAATIAFTFKTRSGSQGYSPRVVIEATGHSIISTYA